MVQFACTCVGKAASLTILVASGITAIANLLSFNQAGGTLSIKQRTYQLPISFLLRVFYCNNRLFEKMARSRDGGLSCTLTDDERVTDRRGGWWGQVSTLDIFPSAGRSNKLNTAKEDRL